MSSYIYSMEYIFIPFYLYTFSRIFSDGKKQAFYKALYRIDTYITNPIQTTSFDPLFQRTLGSLKCCIEFKIF